MFKYLSIILLVVCLVAFGLLQWEKMKHDKTRSNLNNQIAKLEGQVKETETAYSARGQELENLKTSVKDLNKLIEKRDEEIAAIGEVSLQWKNKYLKIKNAKETVVDSGGQPVVDPPTMPDGLRYKVDFDQVDGIIHVFGHTLTNPAYAEVNFEWTRPLKLTFVLTKQNKQYRLYLDSNSLDVVPGQLNLKVDPSVFEREWYEKIGFYGNMSVIYGNGAGGTIGAMYEFGNFVCGPTWSAMSNGNVTLHSFGLSTIWFPFRD